MKRESPYPDNGAACMSGQETGMAWSILTEIGQLLDKLSATGETGAIALRGLPMTDSDRRQLEELLGRGEVRAELDLAGTSEVWETSYAGVWWIRHKGAGERVACEEIAVTRIPEILLTHPVDIQAAALRIHQRITTTGDLENPLETSNV